MEHSMGSTESEGEWREAALKPYVSMAVQAPPGFWGQLGAPLLPQTWRRAPR